MATETFATLLPETSDDVRRLAAKRLYGEGLARAWVDDGTESGALRVVPARNLVARAVRIGSSASAFMRHENNGCTVSTVFAALKGADYASHYTSIQCPAGNYISTRIFLNVYGRHFGLRWYWVSSYTDAPFDVIIDGRPYSVDVRNLEALTGSGSSDADPFFQWICPDVLDDERHQIEICFRGPTSGTTRNYVVRDVLLDAGAGYERQLPALALHGPQTLTTSYAAVAPGSVWGSPSVRLGKLFFFNYSGAAVTVSVASSASDSWRIAAKSVPAGEGWEVDIGGSLGALATPYVKASANTAVYLHATAGQL
jgi:hypothetical protein